MKPVGNLKAQRSRMPSVSLHIQPQWKYRDGGWASASRPFGFPPNYISSWGDPDYLVCTYPNSKTDKTQSPGLFNLFQKKQMQLLAFEFLAAQH